MRGRCARCEAPPFLFGGEFVGSPQASKCGLPAEAGPPDCTAFDLRQVEYDLENLLTVSACHAATLGVELALAGGKRLRPRLFLLAYRCLAPAAPSPGIYRLATALELLHLATLVHDDILDEASMRRAQPSLNAAYGNRAAVLVGDFFFSQFLQVAAPAGARALTLLAATIAAMVEGELEQARHRFDFNLTQDEYYGIIEKKTAALLAAACELGALTARARARERRALRRFGHNLGCAFQVQDDILDYTGDARVVGKPHGADLVQGVITLPLIYVLRTSPRSAQLKDLLRAQPLGPAQLSAIQEEVHLGGGIAYARAQAAEFLERAVKELAALPANPSRWELERLARSLEERQR